MRFKLLRRPAVERITGLSRSAIYEQIARGAFPAPVRLGPNCVAWRSDQIEDWITSRPLARGGAA